MEQAQPMPMPWQQRAMQCVSLLKESRELFKLVIASDSMVAVDQKQDRADNADLLQSTGAFFNQMKEMITEYPPMAKFAIQFQQRVARNYKGGKEVESMYTEMLQQVSQIAEQKMQAASQQPPDPAMVKAQSDMQIAQMQSQNKQAEVQASIQKSMTELQIEQVKAQMEIQAIQMKAQVEQAKQALDTWKAQQDVLIENKKIEVDILKIQATTEIEKANQQIAVMQTNLAATIDALRLRMDEKDSKFNQLAMTVDAHQKQTEHIHSTLAELTKIKSDHVVGMKKASNKPKTPGSLKG